MKTSNTRRDFLKTFAAGTAGAGLTGAAALPARSYARVVGANDRVQVGLVGVGRMMRGHLGNLLGMPERADVVMLADVYQPNLQKASAMAPRAEVVDDYRRVIDANDVDAVVVATPDHWHALPTIHACEAGKDVYVEKPTAVYINESRAMVEAARRHGRIVQVGTQQRSGPQFQQAAELVRSGALGPISHVRTWNYSNAYPDGIGNPPDGVPPPGLNWDLWLGPAPRVPYNPNRFGVFLDENLDYTRWASFRWFWDYAGGMMTDWGVHLLDIVQWAMDVDYPIAVSAHGGKFYLQDNRQTPDTLVATFEYPSFVCTYENRVCNGDDLNGYGYGIAFHGTEGTLYLNRGGFEVKPENGSALEPLRVEAPGGDHARHMADFLDSIASRRPPISDIAAGHRSSSVAMLGNIAYRSGRRLEWDGAAETVTNDPAADRLTRVTYRDPWHL